jgi:N-acetylglutamate synthase-like GNAT family acetyltransferase
MMTLPVLFKPEYKKNSNYDWVNFESGKERVGKSRCKICSGIKATDKPMIIIYNINIYPEWQGRGYGKEFIKYCKCNFDKVIADRVRATAVEFWEAMGFVSDNNGNYVYHNEVEN